MTNLERLKTLRIIPGFLVSLALIYFCYSIDKTVGVPRQVVYGKKTVEEIINTPQPYTLSEPWDKDFKSAIIPIEELK